MLDRVAYVGPLDRRSLRPWHFVLNASVLLTLSPHGYDEGMNGRYAFVQDDARMCASTLTRLRAVLPGVSSVSLLPDRSSAILGLAAGSLLDLPTRAWSSDVDDTVIVAYDLSAIEPSVLSALCERRPGSVLVEHASCWTSPPPVAADVVGLLHQRNIEPWGPRMIAPPDGSPIRYKDPDARPTEEVAADIVAAVRADEELAPGDTLEDLTQFVRGLGDAWPATGPRDRMWSPGPVPSSRFF
jgi:hypothetical protein